MSDILGNITLYSIEYFIYLIYVKRAPEVFSLELDQVL